MAPWATGIQALTLFVEDVAAAKAFYRDVFELDVVFEDPQSVVFRIGSVLINLLNVSEAGELIEPAPVGKPDAGRRFQLTIQVDDVDSRCAELGRRGVTFLNGPIDRAWGVRTAAFEDPAGHVWELAQPIT